MTMVSISEIKARFSHYANKVVAGETFVISKRNRPVAVLRPYQNFGVSQELVFGLAEGKFDIPDGFDEPLEDFEASYYS